MGRNAFAVTRLSKKSAMLSLLFAVRELLPLKQKGRIKKNGHGKSPVAK
jgi:hypothetical protein